MVDTIRKRGRPRKFDPAVALASASRTFLRHGYSGTSVEALADAMHLNKPSLYSAFGDKQALYLSVLQERARMVGERYQAAFEKGRTLEEALSAVFEESVEVTLGEGGPPGCPIASASITEALVDDAIGEFSRDFRARSDRALARWIRSRSSAEGEVSAEGVARLANGVFHDIALRARLGESRAKLRELCKDAAKALARAAGERPSP